MKCSFFSMLVVFFISSCGSMQSINKIKHYQRNYTFNDISGNFLLSFESGPRGERQAYVKRRLIGDRDSKEYEKLVAVSKVGSLKRGRNKISVLRPSLSQYTVWFEKQKYFSQLEILPEQKLLRVRMKSPEEKWNGVKDIPFQNSRGVFCFFNQIIDCVRITGFLSRAIQSKLTRMSLTIVWEGHPFIDEQYSGIDGPFSSSIFSYEGRSREGHFVFNLNFGDQVLFYHLNEEMQLEKKFWVAQGMTQVGI